MTVNVGQTLLESVRLLEVSGRYAPQPGYFVVAQEPGEIVPKKVRQSYFDLIELRGEPVDLDAVPTLMALVEDEARRVMPHVQILPMALVASYANLVDAGNSSLRRKDREMHFDIAGQEVWQYRGHESSTARSFVTRFLSVWRGANGL